MNPAGKSNGPLISKSLEWKDGTKITAIADQRTWNIAEIAVRLAFMVPVAIVAGIRDGLRKPIRTE